MYIYVHIYMDIYGSEYLEKTNQKIPLKVGAIGNLRGV